MVTGLDLRAYRGGEKYAAVLGRALEARGVDVRLLSKVDRNVVHRLRDEELAPVVGLPVDFYRPRLVPLLPPLLPELGRLLRRLRWADTVYAIEATPRLLSALLFLSRLVQRRFVVGLHSPTLIEDLTRSREPGAALPWRVRELLYVLRHSDTVHALTSQQSTALSAWGIRSNLTVVASFPTVPAGEESPSADGTFDALFVGPLEREQKGIDLLVEIGRRVLTSRPRATLTIAGSGSASVLIDPLAREFPDRVRVLGFVPESELGGLYARAHVLLLPSRAEAFPLVALEALCQGTPVVGFEIEGLAEISTVYPEGRVPKWSVEEFAQRVVALEALWETRPLEYRALREHCRAVTEQRFGPDVIVPKLAAMLGLAATSPSPHP